MLPPNVCTTAKDEKYNVTYHVMAYRKLRDYELMEQIRSLHSQKSVRRLKKPLRNRTFTILTIIGATDAISG